MPMLLASRDDPGANAIHVVISDMDGTVTGSARAPFRGCNDMWDEFLHVPVWLSERLETA